MQPIDGLCVHFCITLENKILSQKRKTTVRLGSCAEWLCQPHNPRQVWEQHVRLGWGSQTDTHWDRWWDSSWEIKKAMSDVCAGDFKSVNPSRYFSDATTHLPRPARRVPRKCFLSTECLSYGRQNAWFSSNRFVILLQVSSPIDPRNLNFKAIKS